MSDGRRGPSKYKALMHEAARHARRGFEALFAYLAVVFGRSEPWPRRLRYAVAGMGGLFAGVLVLVMLYGLLLIPFTPGTAELRKAKAERATVVYSADGARLTEFKPFNRHWVSLEAIAPEVRMALLATEDRRFYEHRGIDVRRMAGALLQTALGNRQGGSTITQQLARNLYPDRIGRRATLTRKLKELITTLKIEHAYTKDQILETYLNTVPFLYDAHGIEMAARTYFGTSARELDILEAATLVAMLRGTAYYNPVRFPERARERRNLVLRQMVRADYLREDRYESIADTPLQLRFERQPRMVSEAPHFTEHVRSWLQRWARQRGYNIYRDSLIVHTTLDTRLQEAAMQATEQYLPLLQAIAGAEWSTPEARLLSRSPHAYRGYQRGGRSFAYLWNGRPEMVARFIRTTPQYRAGVAAGLDAEAVVDSLRADAAFMEALRELKTRLEIGFAAIAPGTGHVLAWVGSHDYADVPFDHVARARRQPGSTFKPIVYAAALERGLRPDDTLPDVEVEFELAGGEIWSPVNPGGYSGRDVSLAHGLAYSNNSVTAQLIDEVGVGRVARLARRMGITRSELREVPSLALGTSEVSLLEMTSVYATIAAGGIYRQPVVVSLIEDSRGRVVYEARPRQRRAISEETALRVADMMRGVIDQGTGRRIRTTFGIREDLAGKTGTTQGSTDGWFIAMHPEVVAGAWVGFSDPRVTFRTSYWGQGGNNALLIVGDFYRRAFRHPETRLVGMRFPEAPAYVERVTLLDRVAGWAGDAAAAVGLAVTEAFHWVRERLFGADEDDIPDPLYERERPRAPPADRDLDEEHFLAVADSLNRAERDSVRLHELLERYGTEPIEPLPPQHGDDEPQAPPEDADAGEPPEDPPGQVERDDEGPPGQARRGGPPDSPPGQARRGDGEAVGPSADHAAGLLQR